MPDVLIPQARPCDIRGCPGVAEWRVLGTEEQIEFCRRHRDLIEDEGLDLIEDE